MYVSETQRLGYSDSNLMEIACQYAWNTFN